MKQSRRAISYVSHKLELRVVLCSDPRFFSSLGGSGYKTNWKAVQPCLSSKIELLSSLFFFLRQLS